MSFAHAFASLVVAGLEDTVGVPTCTTSVVDTAERTSESSGRSRGSTGRSLMGSIAVN